MTITAAIDIGTISVRLGIAEVDPRTRSVAWLVRETTICDLGQDVDSTRMLRPDAIARVLACVSAYAEKIRAVQAGRGVSIPVSCTATSAARDAGNSRELMDGLAALGLEPEVIGGEQEGALAFLGASTLAAGSALLVADCGGGSCELAYGAESLAWVHSVDEGARRVTERFGLASKTVDASTADGIRVELESEFRSVLAAMPEPVASDAIVAACGGTATTIAAHMLGLVVYDCDRVHGCVVPRDEVDRFVRGFCAMTVEERSRQVGVQPKRAETIAGGALVLDALLHALGHDAMTVSEADGLCGLVLAACLPGAPGNWRPATVTLS
jgi:exopolyphosphatase/guanosine-5'-triphosphate,3'-diphosphate pyrophosphatase